MTLTDMCRNAYNAYGKVTDFKNYAGLPMPKWEDLPPKIQEAWHAAIQATLDERASAQSELLGRIRQWDHLDGAADGPFWKSEIDKVLP